MDPEFTGIATTIKSTHSPKLSLMAMVWSCVSASQQKPGRRRSPWRKRDRGRRDREQPERSAKGNRRNLRRDPHAMVSKSDPTGADHERRRHGSAGSLRPFRQPRLSVARRCRPLRRRSSPRSQRFPSRPSPFLPRAEGRDGGPRRCWRLSLSAPAASRPIGGMRARAAFPSGLHRATAGSNRTRSTSTPSLPGASPKCSPTTAIRRARRVNSLER